MKDHDKLIARLTDRLSVDPELQMDVAQELQTHLDDSAAEFREAGLTEEQADTEAVKALGDPDELSGQLWSANRNRLRIRGLLRWAARITLVPAAIGVIIAIYFSMGFPIGLGDIPRSWASQLSEEQMYILRGDPAAKMPLERAKSITDRWPKNPVYFGNYVVEAIVTERLRGKLSGAKLHKAQELLTKGQKLDPDNAFYNFTLAALLINSSCELKDDESLSYSVTNRQGEVQQKPCYTVTVENEKMFQQGLAELRAGLKKPRFVIPCIEIMEIRKSIFPTPHNVADILHQLGIETSVLFPSLNDYRNMSKSLLGYALVEARKGNAKIAFEFVQDAEQLANHLGANSATIIETLVAHAIEQMSMGNAAQICKVLGDDQQAENFQARLDENSTFFNELTKRPRGDASELRGAGMYWSILTPSIPGYMYTMDFEPMRTAEQYWINEFGLLGLLVGLTLLTLLMGGMTLVGLWRGNDKSVLMFVGWDRVAKICLWAIVLPIGIYAAYVHFVTVGPDAYGLNVAAGRVILEMIFVSAVICVTLVAMSYSAIRRRAIELGVTVPEPLTLRRRKIFWPMAGLSVLAVAVYIISFWIGHASGKLGRVGFDPPLFHDLMGGRSGSLKLPLSIAATISVIVFAFLMLWGLREFIGLLKRPYRQFRRSLYRNIVPILAAAVIVVGIICGFVLNRAETAAARRVTGDAILSFKAEIDRSDYSQMRDRFAARQAEMKQAYSTSDE